MCFTSTFYAPFFIVFFTFSSSWSSSLSSTACKHVTLNATLEEVQQPPLTVSGVQSQRYDDIVLLEAINQPVWVHSMLHPVLNDNSGLFQLGYCRSMGHANFDINRNYPLTLISVLCITFRKCRLLWDSMIWGENTAYCFFPRSSLLCVFKQVDAGVIWIISHWSGG